MRKFFKTVAIVTVFSICEKFLGFLYRIYLSRTIGAEGMGLYQVALSIFALLLTICCSGTPVTVSRLMTKYKAEGKMESVHRIITAGLGVTLLIALPVCALCYLLGGKLSFLFADERALKIFLIVLPGLVFTSLYAVIRGVFWGNKDFLPYSIIELLEEAVMIIVGIILISFSTNIYDGAYRAGFAVLISYIFSFTTASIVFFVRKNRLKNPKKELKPLIKSAAPITAMRTATSLAMSLVSVILPIRLVDAGMSESLAMSAFGSAMGQAIPLLFIPTTLIGSFTLVLVPEIAENFYKKRHYYLKRDIEKAITFSTILSCVFIPVFLVCGEEIGILIFGGHESGKYLTASCFLMLFMSLSSVTTSMLNSIGLENKTLFYYVISGAFMLLSIWFLPKFIGVYSLIVGLGFVYGLTTILNLRLINKNCVEKPRYKRFMVGTISLLFPTALVGVMLEKMLLAFLGSFFTLLVCAFVMVLFYSALAIGFNLVEIKPLMEKIKNSLFKKRQNFTRKKLTLTKK